MAPTRKTIILAKAVCGTALLLLALGCGPEPAAIQSALRLKDLGLAGPVMRAGSDRASRVFYREHLPGMIKAAAQKFNKETIARAFADVVLDPARLELAERTRVRVYFVGEASGYVCALGVNTEGAGIEHGRPLLIFPNKDTATHLYGYPKHIDPETGWIKPEARGERSPEAPLQPGDFADLGSLPAGTRLSFFLIAKEPSGAVRVYTTEPSRNPDGIDHVVAIAVEGTPFLMLSFEDMFQGGDRDFSDCVFAVEMSAYNIQALLGQIDPWRQVKRLVLLGALAGIVLGGPAVYAAWLMYIRRKRFAKTQDDAKHYIRSGLPEEAVRVIRETKRRDPNKERRFALTELELEALERMGDFAHIMALAKEAPGNFAQSESAALAAARAFVESGREDDYAALRAQWQDHTRDAASWCALDADVLHAQDKPREAFELLRSTPFGGPSEAKRLARLGMLLAETSPKHAQAYLERAAEIAPNLPDAYLARAQACEAWGQTDAAHRAYQQALECAPRDPFLRDRLAEFLRRAGRHDLALETWAKGLEPPSMEAIWLKTLFWRRVSVLTKPAWDGLEPPPGPARPLIGLLCGLEPRRFWEASAFEAIAEHHPHLASRQEVFWLRLCEALKCGREDAALNLLNLDRFGARSWNEDLETALVRIVTYRRSGFMDPTLVQSTPHAMRLRPRHPFFAALDQWTQGEQIYPPREIDQLIKSDWAFPAVFWAAGWWEAGLLLRRTALVPADLPPWVAAGALAALRANRSEDQVRHFAERHGLA